MSVKIYECDCCNREFNESEYSITKDESKCILHCLKKDRIYWNDNQRISKFTEVLILNVIFTQLKLELFDENMLLMYFKNELNQIDGLDEDIKKISNSEIEFNSIFFPIHKNEFEYNYLSIFKKLGKMYFNSCDFIYHNFLVEEKAYYFLECNFLSGIKLRNVKCLNSQENLFTHCNFLESVYSYEKIVSEKLFYRCTIDTIDFNCSTFEKKVFVDEENTYNKIKNIRIYDCLFKNDFIINDSKDNGFISDNINIEKGVFEGKFKLRHSIIKGKSELRTCKFKKLVDFFGSTFDDVSFYDSRFYKMTVFTKVKINESIDFQYTYFFDIVQFKDIELNESTFDFSETTFEKPGNFLNIKSKNENKIVANRETARRIKDSFEQQNNIIEANKFYALEMKEREKELKWGKDFFEKLVFSVHGWSSNHSQDWLLSLFWILNISFITSIFSCSIDETFNALKYLDRTFSILLTIIILGVGLFKSMVYIGKWSMLLLTSSIYLIYAKVVDSYSLDNIANKINPFSIMNSWDDISFNEFIYKVVIAYLIYQLIMSIRQNTRRK